MLLFWCQHSLGLGHLARAMRLAEGLAAHFDVVLLNGGRFPPGTWVPAGVSVVNLPPLGHDEDFRLVSHEPGDRRRAPRSPDGATSCSRRWRGSLRGWC